MVELSVRSNERICAPKNAVVLYGDRMETSFATVHDIVRTETGVPHLTEGVAVSTEGLMALFEGLDPQRGQRATLLSTRVLSQGTGWLVWYARPTRKRVWFDAKDIGRVTAEVPIPGLVFAVVGKAMMVFAYDHGRRPGLATVLKQAPFYNVWATGQVCTGSMTLPHEDERQNPDTWERGWWESAFTHSNVHQPDKLVNYRRGAAAFWKAMLKGKFERFPTEVLVDRGFTLANLLAHINSKGRER